jgi:hypothetical protein
MDPDLWPGVTVATITVTDLDRPEIWVRVDWSGQTNAQWLLAFNGSAQVFVTGPRSAAPLVRVYSNQNESYPGCETT